MQETVHRGCIGGGYPDGKKCGVFKRDLRHSRVYLQKKQKNTQLLRESCAPEFSLRVREDGTWMARWETVVERHSLVQPNSYVEAYVHSRVRFLYPRICVPIQKFFPEYGAFVS